VGEHGPALAAVIGDGSVWFMGKLTDEALRQDELATAQQGSTTLRRL
jgi:hypothetical protein